jgi:hypothetical protein
MWSATPPIGPMRCAVLSKITDCADRLHHPDRLPARHFPGKDLSVTYRFSIDLLPHWREIERDVRTRIELWSINRQSWFSSLVVEVDVEDRHREIVGQIAVLIVAENDADELVAEIDFRRIILGGRALITRLSLKMRLK